MLRNGLFLSARSLLAMGSLMWATRLIAGFGAVGLAGEGLPKGRGVQGGGTPGPPGRRDAEVPSGQGLTCLALACGLG